MRFMMLMIPKVYQGAGTPADFAPDAEMVSKMMRYNEDLAKAGLLVSLDGLTPPSTGARIAFSGGKTAVTEGPFAESKEVLGGFWILRARSREEVIQWARRCPAQDGDVIEVRQIFEMEDFPPEQQEAAKSPLLEAHMKEEESRRTR